MPADPAVAVLFESHATFRLNRPLPHRENHSSMKQPRISHENFTLPFVEDQRFESPDLDTFEREIPEEAFFLGSVDSSVDNWCSWQVKDHFYLLPWKDGQYDWALFRISWDDNWSRFGWTTDSRIAGVARPTKAAQLLLQDAFQQWGIDLSQQSSEPYRRLLGRRPRRAIRREE
jgi:hypothetical protein